MNLDAHFKFRIGDLVQLRVEAARLGTDFHVNGPVRDYERVKTIAPIVINGRILEECHGGVQGFYVVRDFNSDRALRIAEHELVPWDEIVSLIREATAAKREVA